MRFFLCVIAASLFVAACGDDGKGSGTNQVTRAKEKLGKVEREVKPATKRTEPNSFADLRTQNVRTMADFLTAVLNDVDRYWTRTLTAAGDAEPFVRYNWLRPGERVVTKCRKEDGTAVVTSDDTAAYCPGDDTIYVSQRFAIRLWNGLVGNQNDPLPGDFGVAYAVAHEYGHNVQRELGIYNRTDLATKNFELEADCMAGVWGNSAYYEGILDPGDPEEAIATAHRLGDFDFFNPAHHGTPEERQEAWSTGYNSGDPGACNAYTP